jgi:hypothetical protein
VTDNDAEPRQTDNAFTVMAIATLAICTTTLAHEAMGHGGMCLLLGGRVVLLNNAFFHCSIYSPLIDGAGPTGNLLAGLVAFAAQSLITPTRPALRLYALLVSAFSLFWESGYVIFSFVNNRGDYVDVWKGIVGLSTVAVRVCGAVIGIAAYVLFNLLVRLRARSFASAAGRIPGIFRLAWITAIASMIIAGSLFAPDRLGAMRDAGLSAFAAFPLLFLSSSLRPPDIVADPIRRSFLVIALGAIGFVLFCLTLGSGLY